MVTGEIKKDEENYKTLDGKQLELFANFTSTPFNYHLIPWVTNYAYNHAVCETRNKKDMLPQQLCSLWNWRLGFVTYDVDYNIAWIPKFKRLSSSCLFLRNSNFPLSWSKDYSSFAVLLVITKLYNDRRFFLVGDTQVVYKKDSDMWRTHVSNVVQPSFGSAMPLSLMYWIPLCRFKEGGLERTFFLFSLSTLALRGWLVPKLFLQLKQRQLSVQPCPLPKHGHLVFLSPLMSAQDTNPWPVLFLPSPHLHFTKSFTSALLLQWRHLQYLVQFCSLRTQGHREVWPSAGLQDSWILDFTRLPQQQPFCFIVAHSLDVVETSSSSAHFTRQRETP